VYEANRILELSGLDESKFMNAPANTSMEEPKVYDKLPSKPGQGGGNKTYGQNRANNQGENPMDGLDLEEAVAKAMGEYRKFVAENLASKK
jgi:hypothetical protein